ncbi:MAG: hypothetical protein GX456_18710 [Verrucomicrobia bacterium]|nr:hypothetical protein [Verrucomicrobiota bacterium]
MDRFGAAKNRRAPARVGKGNGAGSATVPGRIEPMTDRKTCFNHANPAPEHGPVGCGEESPRSRRALETATAFGSAAVSAASVW